MEEKNKYNQCLLLNGYEFLDFENTKNTTLKEWLKDENFLLFIKSIPKDYIFIIKKYGIANGIFLTHKKTFEFAQKILEKVKDINFDFSYSEFEFNQNIFYALNFENKEISFTELVFSFKINSLDRESFDISNIYNKKHFIIQKDNSLITFKYKKIQSKGFNLVFLGGCKSQHYRYARPYGFFGGSIPFFIRIRRSSIISFCKGWHTGTDPYTVSCTTDNEDSDNFFHQ